MGHVTFLGEWFKQLYGPSLKDINYDFSKMREAVYFNQDDLQKGSYITDKKIYEKIRERLANRSDFPITLDVGVCDYLCNIATLTNAVSNRRNFLRTFPNCNLNSEQYKEEEGKRSEQFIGLLKKLETAPTTGRDRMLINLANFVQNEIYELFKVVPFSTLSVKDHKNILKRDANAEQHNINEETLNKVLNKMKIGDERKIWMSNIRRKPSKKSFMGKLELILGISLAEMQQGTGHSVMIYKAEEDKFNFFDPNTGFLEGLTTHQTSITFVHSFNLNNKTLEGKLNNISFLDNKKILDKVKKRNEDKLIYGDMQDAVKTVLYDISISGVFIPPHLLFD